MNTLTYSIILEPLNGAHSIKLGEYYLDLQQNILYVGIGNFGQNGGVTPVGTVEINQNGEYDVTLIKNVIVNVADEASGTQVITENGIYDIATKAFVDVQVGDAHGTIEISANGTYDVTNKATAVVNVPSVTPLTIDVEIVNLSMFPVLNIVGDITIDVEISIT